MYRRISEYFKAWKENKYRKPLIVQGARQVGKTYSILEFGRTHYDMSHILTLKQIQN